MRVVLDANVFVSAVIEPRGYPARILQAWRAGRVDLVVSEDIIAEIAEVLRRPRLRKRHQWSDEQLDVLLATLRELALITPGLLEVKAVGDDPDDDTYLACALEGEADYLASGDDHLNSMGEYHGVTIVTPLQLVMILSPHNSPTNNPPDNA